MTSIRNPLATAVGVGSRFCLELDERDGILVADHPLETSPLDIAVVEGVDGLDERPPGEPVEVEITRRVLDDRVVGRLVGTDCPAPTDRN